MATQSPLIWLPAKQTSEVDVATPVGKLIQTSYGEDPKQYASALSTLNRTRQDAMRGGASDQTARDLLLKWFHMLEMLELRFPELRTPFPWHDAFTNKQTTQQSLAYEKACVLFNIAAALTSFAASRPRLPGNADGFRTAFTSLRQAAGMLGYIKDNFLHAPSTDMSADVLKILIGLCLAQAAEVIYEKAVEDKKNPALIAKIASQVATAYHQVADDVRQWSNKSVLERLWHVLTQAKSKLFSSYMQYHRALADEATGNHGACLVRLTIADTAAKDAVTQAANYYFMGSGWLASPTMPNDAATTFQAMVKQHATVVAERKVTAEKDNDLIYHDVLPTESSLPSVDPVEVATPINVQDVYTSPEVEKIVSPDLFTRLVPLQVHESASLYSEEKAKLARAESERSEVADMELATALEYTSLPSALVPLKAATGQATGGSEDALADPPSEVFEWSAQEQQAANPEAELQAIDRLRLRTGQDIQSLTTLLDDEAAACERGRAQWGSSKWTMDPSGAHTRTMRSDLRANREAHAAAAGSDQRIVELWTSIRDQVGLLQGGRLKLEQAYAEAVASAPTHARKGSLLDAGEEEDLLESSSDEQMSKLVNEVDTHYAHLIRLRKERAATLTDLKDKLRDDDISQVLVLHSRSPRSTPAIFQAELDKFRPYQQRLGLVNEQQAQALKQLNAAWSQLNQLPKARQASAHHVHAAAARDGLTQRLRLAHQQATEVRVAVQRGQKFYADLEGILKQIRSGAEQFVTQRKSQRDQLTSKLEWDEKATLPTGAPAAPPAVPVTVSSPSPHAQDLASGFGSISLGESSSPSPLAPRPAPPPVPRADSWASTGSSGPPAPPKPTVSPYDSMFSQGPFASYASPPAPSVTSPPPAGPRAPPPPQQGYTASAPGLPPPPSRFQSQYQLPPQQPAQTAYPPPPTGYYAPQKYPTPSTGARAPPAAPYEGQYSRQQGQYPPPPPPQWPDRPAF